MDNAELSQAEAPADHAPKTKRTRGKKTHVEVANDPHDVFAQNTPPAEFRAGHHDVENAERPKPPIAEEKKPWQQQFSHWKNNDAGVRLEEGRKHGLATIVSRDRLPDAALDLLDKRGWQEDPQAGGFSKKLDRWRAGDGREQALETVKDVANVILAGKGLPELKSAYVSRS